MALSCASSTEGPDHGLNHPACPTAALRDGVGAAQPAARLQYLRNRQVRPGEGHRLLILGEVLAVRAKPGDEVMPVEPGRERPGPVAPTELRDVARPARVPLSQEPGRFTQQDRLAVMSPLPGPLNPHATSTPRPTGARQSIFAPGAWLSAGARAGGR